MVMMQSGEVMVVDEVSLIKVGPIRVKVRAQEMAKIHGYDAKFVPELPKVARSEIFWTACKSGNKTAISPLFGL
jgi:hypothetical protein